MGEVLIRYGLDLLKLHIGMYACFGTKTKFPWGQIAGGVVSVLAAAVLEPSGFPISVLTYLAATITVFFSVDQSWKKRGYQVIILFVLINGLSEMIDGPRSLYQILNETEIEETTLIVVTNSLISCMILGIFGFIRRSTSEEWKQKFFERIQKSVPWMLVIVIFNIFILISVLGISLEYIQDDVMIKVFGILEFISFFNVLLLACFILYIWETNRKMIIAQKQMEDYRRAEKAQYELLIKKDTETRKYRHDMKKHLICMEHLAEEEAWPEVKAYLATMSGRMKKISSQYETGDRILDIITNHLLMELPEGTEIKIYGGVGSIGSIQQEDLCTIYANLIQNAVEELCRDKRGQHGFLKIYFTGNERFLQIEIENTLSEQKKDLSTKKTNKEWHGFGILNVKETVEKNNGEIQIEIREQSFYVSVILPL